MSYIDLYHDLNAAIEILEAIGFKVMHSNPEALDIGLEYGDNFTGLKVYAEVNYKEPVWHFTGYLNNEEAFDTDKWSVLFEKMVETKMV